MKKSGTGVVGHIETLMSTTAKLLIIQLRVLFASITKAAVIKIDTEWLVTQGNLCQKQHGCMLMSPP